MRKWYLPLTVLGVAGLAALVLSERARESVRRALGRMDEAYPLLERSYRARNFMFLWFNLTHVFELLPFPMDERIKRILARMRIASSPW